MVRVDVVDQFPELAAHLSRFLAELEPDDWVSPTPCPGWRVHDIATHLLGVEVANLAVRRDGWRPDRGPTGDQGLDEWNQAWVDACRRTSPAVLVGQLDEAAGAFAAYVATLDLDAVGGPVGWAAGARPAPVWLDVAREYMERCVHQAQMRATVGGVPLPDALVEPVVATAVHALPVALAAIDRPVGTTVVFRVDSGSAAWSVVREEDRWALVAGDRGSADCEVTTDLTGAVQLFVRAAEAPEPQVTGDTELGRAVGRAKAILG